jgi:hypothetical protein
MTTVHRGLRARLAICHTLGVMRAAALLLALASIVPAQNGGTGAVPVSAEHAGSETLTYAVEWRLIRAGTAKLTWNNTPRAYQGDLKLDSVGMVSKLYKVDDTYRVLADSSLCASSTYFRANEGKRQRETRVNIDSTRKKAIYNERDLVKNTEVLSKTIDVPACVHDILGGLQKMRGLRLEPGQAVDIPITDGKKYAAVRVEAQDREKVTTRMGTYNAMRYEVFIFNDVILKRPARCYVWITDDGRRLPVQIRVKMQFLIGTVSLTLESA